MFTGIVRERARVVSFEDGRLVVESSLAPAVGDSIAVDGTCLTHVDGVGRVRSFEGERLTIEAPPEILRYCVEKGSITLDGVALTLTAVAEDSFEVALVPHTLEVTTLGGLEPGEDVNLEADLLAKYVEKLIA